MRSVRIAIMALASIVPATALAQTKPSVLEKTLGDWTVYGEDGDCWMRTVNSKGSELLLSTSDDDGDLYVVMRKPAWTFIKEDGNYPMRVQFTGTDVTKPASGSVGEGKITPGMVMFLTDSSRDYLADLRKSPTIRLWLRGKPTMRVSMAGAGPALAYFAQCTLTIRAAVAR